MIRTVSAAAAIANTQLDRLDKLSLPLVRLNEYAQRSDPTTAAWGFLDQIRSDYRRVSPHLDLRQVEQWRTSYEGAAVLNDAQVENQSVGVLAVGELLDSHQPIWTLAPWIAAGDVPAADMADFTSPFGLVLGPIVQFALSPRHESRPLWAPDLDSEAGHQWVDTFIQAGAQILNTPWRTGVASQQATAATRARAL